jgi:hypothetical protein
MPSIHSSNQTNYEGGVIESITIPRNHTLFAHFLHRGDTYAIPPRDVSNMRPYQTIYL